MKIRNLDCLPDMVEVKVPEFPGFYRSIIDDCDGGLLEMENDYAMQDGRPLAVDYSMDYDLVAESYVKYVCENCAGFSIVEYSGIDSPREYNFRTDYAFARVPFDEINRMYRDLRKNDLKVLEQCLEENFKSRSGFYSFIDCRLDGDDWDGSDKSEWNCHQWGAVLQAWLYARFCGYDENAYRGLAFGWYGHCGSEAIRNATTFKYQDVFTISQLHDIRVKAREYLQYIKDNPDPYEVIPQRFTIDWESLRELRYDDFTPRGYFYTAFDDWLEELNLPEFLTPVYWQDRKTLPLFTE